MNTLKTEEINIPSDKISGSYVYLHHIVPEAPGKYYLQSYMYLFLKVVELKDTFLHMHSTGLIAVVKAD